MKRESQTLSPSPPDVRTCLQLHEKKLSPMRRQSPKKSAKEGCEESPDEGAEYEAAPGSDEGSRTGGRGASGLHTPGSSGITGLTKALRASGITTGHTVSRATGLRDMVQAWGI